MGRGAGLLATRKRYDFGLKILSNLLASLKCEWNSEKYSIFGKECMSGQLQLGN